MRLVLDSNSSLNLVRRYGNGEIQIGEQCLTRPLILMPNRLIADWSANSFDSLNEQDLAALFGTGAQVILLGAGERQSFPSASVRASFRARRVALECMTLGAACRTYNILASEERPVAAGLFP